MIRRYEIKKGNFITQYEIFYRVEKEENVLITYNKDTYYDMLDLLEKAGYLEVDIFRKVSKLNDIKNIPREINELREEHMSYIEDDYWDDDFDSECRSYEEGYLKALNDIEEMLKEQGVLESLLEIEKPYRFNESYKQNFIKDKEKMVDFEMLTKEEFLELYSYLTEEEYDNTAELLKERNGK